MTRNNYLSKIRTKFVVFLALVLALTVSAVGLIACNKEEAVTVTDPDYTYSEPETNALVSNASFTLGVETKALTDFPISSPSGWTKATDKSSASAINSGVVDVSQDGWKELVTTLKKDSDFTDHFGEDVSETSFASPSTHDGATDNYVYMLNNYTKKTYDGFGCAQKLTSASTLTLEAGKFYKLSVWIKAYDLKGNGESNDFASIRLVNSFNGNSQSEYRLNGIKEDAWTQYEIYIAADKAYGATVTVVLGLGYGDNESTDGKYYTQGTVYFDDVAFTEIEDTAYAAVSSATKKSMTYGSEEKLVQAPQSITVDEKALNIGIYEMKFNVVGSPSLFSDSDDNYFFTKSNIKNTTENITSKNIYSDGTASRTLSDSNKTIKIDVSKASYTLRIDNAGLPFELSSGKYNLLSFSLLNNLVPFGSTDITVDVFDIYGTTTEKRAAVTTYSTPSDTAVKCELLFKNNFDTGTRKFYIEIVIGPSDITAVTKVNQLASGSVVLSDLSLYNDDIDSTDDTTHTDKENKIDNKVYSFFSSVADATTALYAGNSADYSEDSDKTESYSLTVAPGNTGDIVSVPTAPKGYYGITSNHIYLTDPENQSTLETDINTRTGRITAGQSYAGLINTKYISAYGDSALTTLLSGDYSSDSQIQPLVIFNASSDHYGFIGDSQSIAASAYGKVSVTLKVGEGAKAYIYLVDTASAEKTVMTFNLPENYEANSKVIDDANRELSTIVASTNGEWKTIEFYVAAGAESKDFRVELWNGARENETDTASVGYVVVKDVTVTTSGAFTEPTKWSEAFSVSGNPLYTVSKTNLEGANDELVSYTRALTETETKYNAEYPDSAVNYKANYIWAKNSTFIYAIYNTIEPVETDPYADVEEEETESGCSAKSDPSAFWLGFSSIALAVVLVLAIIALVIKNVRRKRIANKSDAKSHYVVKSRIKSAKELKKHTAEKKSASKVDEQPLEDDDDDESEISTDEESIKEEPTDTENSENAENQELDSYVYGEVQNFGDAETNEQKDVDTSEQKNDKE